MESRPYRVMIDPSHGGGDPGAVNKRLGIKEKDINLAVALSVHDLMLSGDYLIKPYLTRSKDESISLWTRVNKAELYATHAFVSIHTNARYLKGRAGVEVEVYHYKNSMRGKDFASLVLRLLLSEISIVQKVISRGIKIGSYYVLRKTSMPSVLVELGFLSDDEEAIFLSGAPNQKLMAKAIAEATELYFEGGGHERVL